MSDMERGLSDEWSDWLPGGITSTIEGDVMLETTIGLDGVSRHRHRWRRYRHESAMLALLRTGGISMMLVTREGPCAPEGGGMTAPVITCACCGRPLHALTSYAVSVPLEGPIQPVDLCGLACLAEWTKSAQAERNRRAQ